LNGFYGSNDPTNSVKALKEDRPKGLGFNCRFPRFQGVFDVVLCLITVLLQVKQNVTCPSWAQTDCLPPCLKPVGGHITKCVTQGQCIARPAFAT